MKPINQKQKEGDLIFRKAFCIVIMFFSISCDNKVNTSNNNRILFNDVRLIQFENLGPSDKPVPTVVFYTDSFDKFSLRYGESFKISRQDANSIAKIVLMKAEPFSEKYKNFYYQILIVNGQQKAYYNLSNKQLVSEFFHEILNSLSDSPYRLTISDYLKDYVLPGLW